jgi:hypothetical protein
VPEFSSEIVVLVPVPVLSPGLMVHVPVAGNPLNTTLPVATVQVGCVMTLKIGAAGVEGCGLITTLAEDGEIHPAALVTVKLYVFAASPVTVILVPVPVVVMLPGFLVRVHVPEEGRPLRATLPVATSQAGWVLVPTTGAAGAEGIALITTLPVAGETHADASVTVKV